MNVQAVTDISQFEEFDEVYSNFDHVEPRGAEEFLRKGGTAISHPAMDHNGWIYFEDGVFKEQVFRYHERVEVVEAPSLRDLFEAVNEKYGSR